MADSEYYINLAETLEALMKRQKKMESLRQEGKAAGLRIAADIIKGIPVKEIGGQSA